MTFAPRRVPSRICCASLAIVYALAIFALSSVPGDRMPGHGLGLGVLNNLFHAPLFFGLGALVALAVAGRGPSGPVLGWKRVAAGVTICFAYAVFDEWHQSFTRGRSPDFFDVATDLAGIAAAMIVVSRWAGHEVRGAGAQVCGLLLVALGSSWLGAR